MGLSRSSGSGLHDGQDDECVRPFLGSSNRLKSLATLINGLTRILFYFLLLQSSGKRKMKATKKKTRTRTTWRTNRSS